MTLQKSCGLPEAQQFTPTGTREPAANASTDATMPCSQGTMEDGDMGT